MKKNFFFKTFEIMFVKRSFLIDHSKVGSTTWLEYFVHLSNLPAEEKAKISEDGRMLHDIIPKTFDPWKSLKKPVESGNGTHLSFNEKLKENKILSFTFVRHPFDR